MLLPEVKNIFASRTQLWRSKHMVFSLTIMKTMLTKFQCCSFKMTNGVTKGEVAYCQIDADMFEKYDRTTTIANG